MIYILHGEDTFASYNRLQTILKSRLNLEKIILDKNTSLENYYQVLFGQDLVNSQKIIVLENFLGEKKISLKNLEEIDKNATVILWEKTKLPLNKSRNLNLIAKVEEFKTPATIFYFLDAISPKPQKPLEYLIKLSSQNQPNLIWHLLNRVLLLILVKNGTNCKRASQIVAKEIQDWQWHKIKLQAETFSKDTLYKIFNGLLRTDYLIKTGRSDIDQNLFISQLLLKYLGR